MEKKWAVTMVLLVIMGVATLGAIVAYDSWISGRPDLLDQIEEHIYRSFGRSHEQRNYRELHFSPSYNSQRVPQRGRKAWPTRSEFSTVSSLPPPVVINDQNLDSGEVSIDDLPKAQTIFEGKLDKMPINLVPLPITKDDETRIQPQSKRKLVPGIHSEEFRKAMQSAHHKVKKDSQRRYIPLSQPSNKDFFNVQMPQHTSASQTSASHPKCDLIGQTYPWGIKRIAKSFDYLTDKEKLSEQAKTKMYTSVYKRALEVAYKLDELRSQLSKAEGIIAIQNLVIQQALAQAKEAQKSASLAIHEKKILELELAKFRGDKEVESMATYKDWNQQSNEQVGMAQIETDTKMEREEGSSLIMMIENDEGNVVEINESRIENVAPKSDAKEPIETRESMIPIEVAKADKFKLEDVSSSVGPRCIPLSQPSNKDFFNVWMPQYTSASQTSASRPKCDLIGQTYPWGIKRIAKSFDYLTDKEKLSQQAKTEMYTSVYERAVEVAYKLVVLRSQLSKAEGIIAIQNLVIQQALAQAKEARKSASLAIHEKEILELELAKFRADKEVKSKATYKDLYQQLNDEVGTAQIETDTKMERDSDVYEEGRGLVTTIENDEDNVEINESRIENIAPKSDAKEPIELRIENVAPKSDAKEPIETKESMMPVKVAKADKFDDASKLEDVSSSVGPMENSRDKVDNNKAWRTFESVENAAELDNVGVVDLVGDKESKTSDGVVEVFLKEVGA